MTVIKQVVVTGIACYIYFIMGLMFTWPSCVLKRFASSSTTLNRPMKEYEIACLGSLSAIGALVSNPIAAYYMDVIGRKPCVIVASLTLAISWGLIVFSTQVELILLAVFVSGLGGAIFFVLPVLVSEICHESIRGVMTTIQITSNQSGGGGVSWYKTVLIAGLIIFYNIGMLVCFLLGGTLSYYALAYTCIIMSTVGLALLFVIRESPVFLMKIGFDEKAAKSFAFYRSAKLSSEEVKEEMEKLRRAFTPELEEEELLKGISLEEKYLNGTLKTASEKISSWQFFKQSASTRRAAFVVFTILTAISFQGLVVVQVYAVPLFEDAVPNISATVCSVVFSIIMIVAGLISAYLTDVSGRRPLMIHASTFAGVCCIALGTQLHFHWAPHWVTAVLIYLFSAAYTFGSGTVPYLLIVEVFLPEIRSMLTMLLVQWTWVCHFIILFIFNPLVSAIGLGPVFYIFAIVCLATAAFCAKFQPETKGLLVDEIQTLFVKKKSNKEPA